MNIASLDLLTSFHGISTVFQQTNYTALRKVSLQWYLLYWIKFHHIFSSLTSCPTFPLLPFSFPFVVFLLSNPSFPLSLLLIELVSD